MAAAAVVVFIVSLPGFPRADLAWPILNGPAIIGLSAMGALLATRRPENRIGVLMLVAGGLMSAVVALAAYAIMGAGGLPEGRPGASLAGVAARTLFDQALVVALIGIPLIFPDGHLISPRWRWTVALMFVAMASDAISSLIGPGRVEVGGLDNPLGIEPLRPVSTGLQAFSLLAAPIGFVAATAALWVRFRRGSAIERQQLKWLVPVAVIAAIVLPISFVLGRGAVSDTLTAVGVMSFGAVPIAIGIAVMRYQLYAIDRIISRTISWAIVTALLALAFGLSVLGLQALLVPLTGHDAIAVAGSTLVVASLFQPLRLRVQRIVDERFQRSRYDSETLVRKFSERLRWEVDLGAIENEVLATVHAAMQPDGASLWARSGRPLPGTRNGSPSGRRLTGDPTAGGDDRGGSVRSAPDEGAAAASLDTQVT